MLSLFVAFLFDLRRVVIIAILCYWPNSITISTAGRRPGRRPGLRPGFRQVRVRLRPAREFLGSKAGRRQVRSISTRRDSSNLVADPFAAGFRPACYTHTTRRLHTGLRPGRRPGLRLDSIMKFGLIAHGRQHLHGRAGNCRPICQHGTYFAKKRFRIN